MKKVRCAIYTRKSSEEGLDQDFNSLDAQRETCEAYVASQKHEGWIALPEHYDDGGVSGGTLERSGLQRLLQAIDDGLVDQIIVYKIDRLTRSLIDFSRLIERLGAANASFVSVTQSFNTATSMGRLTLNVLLSFAQFEREVTAERIRDKIAASKKKGMWMGGPVPLGYRTENTSLIILEDEAATVRLIYDLYQQHQTVKALKRAVDQHGLVSRERTSKSGKPMGGTSYSRGHLYRILTNPIYVGRVRHKGKTFEGLHEGVIPLDQWQSVQNQLASASARHRQFYEQVYDPANDIVRDHSSAKSGTEPSCLIGKLFDETGDRLTPSHANKKGRRYRYYVSNRLIKKSGETPTVGGWRLPAQQLEQSVCTIIRDWLNRPSQVLKELYPDNASTERLENIIQCLKNLNDRLIDNTNQMTQSLSPSIAKVTLGEGKLIVELDRHGLLLLLELTPPSQAENRTNEHSDDAIIITSPFEHRKRGVESKLMIGTKAAIQPDHMLITNIAKARDWLTSIKAGCSISEIAKNESRSIKQIQRYLELAFLSPKIIKMITEGTQPPELTPRQLINTAIPMDWNQQEQKLGIN